MYLGKLSFIFCRHSIILLVLLFSAPTPGTADVHTYFTPIKDVFATYSTWMLTFTVNLTPYQKQMQVLETELAAVHSAFQKLPSLKLDSKMAPSHHLQYAVLANNTAQVTATEFEQIWHEYWQMDDALYQLSALMTSKNRAKRPPRAIIPVFGELLGFLFGTSTRKDLNKLRQSFLKLKQDQIRVIEVLENGMSLLNKTHSVVRENRLNFNKLVNATQKLHTYVSELKFKLLSMEPLLWFNQLQTKLNYVFHVVYSSLRQTQWDIQALQTAVRDANKGKLPMTLINPIKLQAVLQKVAKTLPDGFVFPADPVKNIQWYFRNLHAILIPNKSLFHIVTVLPLAQRHALFTIYEALTLPIPHPTLDLVARYELEATHLAVTQDKTDFVLLSNTEVSRCAVSDVTHCSFQQPVLSMTHNPTCMSALFTNDQSAIKQNCRKKITTHDRFPMAFYLQEGRWLIASRSQFTLHIACPVNTRDQLHPYDISQPIQIITLQPGCTGHSRHFKLLPYFHQKTFSSAQPILTSPTDVTSLLSTIWNFSSIPVEQLSSKLDVSSLILENVTPLPVDKLQQVLDRAKYQIQTQPGFGSKSRPILITAIVTLVVGAIMGILLIFVYFRYCKLFPRKRVKVMKTVHSDDISGPFGGDCETLSAVPMLTQGDTDQYIAAPTQAGQAGCQSAVSPATMTTTQVNATLESSNNVMPQPGLA